MNRRGFLKLFGGAVAATAIDCSPLSALADVVADPQPALEFTNDFEVQQGPIDLYVRGMDGDDGNPGTISKPLSSLQAALDKIPNIVNDTVVIHVGPHSPGGYVLPVMKPRIMNADLFIIGEESEEEDEEIDEEFRKYLDPRMLKKKPMVVFEEPRAVPEKTEGPKSVWYMNLHILLKELMGK